MKLRVFPAVVAALLLVGACSSSRGGAHGELQKVTLTLNWYPYGEHAPLYYGLKQGIFTKHGIDLTIRPGTGSRTTVQATGTGRTDFGWADTPSLVTAVASGLPARSVGVFLQTTPTAVESLCDKHIRTPKDLVGKTIAATAGDAPSATFPAFLKANGLSEGDVHLENIDAAGKIAAVLSGRTDALIGFVHDQGPTMANKSGKQVCYLRYSDYGVQFYSTGLITSEKMIKQDSQVVRNMVTATSEAFTAAESNPDAAVSAMQGASPQLPPKEVLQQSWQQTIKLLHTPSTQGDAPGVDNDADWQHTIDVLAHAGILKQAGTPADYWDRNFAPKG
jgi:NitT/TauT family transport system substrate-binding protein